MPLRFAVGAWLSADPVVQIKGLRREDKESVGGRSGAGYQYWHSQAVQQNFTFR